MPIIPKIMYYLQLLIFNSSVPPSTKIGKHTVFAYGGIGVVIHARTTIGDNCIIGQGVTIGGKSKIYNVPQIGNNVYISAGSRILGDVKIGDNVVIGANAVVVKDVPSNSIVAGVPAKIIKRGIDITQYMDCT
jgi:serine O-acetyltransferase